MIVTMTSRGYQSLQFNDQAGNRGIAECSSEIDYGNPHWTDPGSSYLLIGRQGAPVQLNIDQVGELVEHLQRWLETGQFCERFTRKAVWSQPGDSYLLIGRQDAPVQLNSDQLSDLIEYMQRWLETGRLADAVPGHLTVTNLASRR